MLSLVKTCLHKVKNEAPEKSVTFVPGTTEKLLQQNHKTLFCYLHSGPKHISQLSKALLTLNKEFIIHTLNCTWITRYINNIMFSMWLAFFIKVWKPVPELSHLMNFFRFAFNKIFCTNKTIPRITRINNFGSP